MFAEHTPDHDAQIIGAMGRFALVGLFIWFCVKKYKEGKREGKPK